MRLNPQLAAADFNRVRGILEEHDPRQMKAGTIRTLSLSDRELNLVTNYLLNYYYGSGVAEVQFGGETLTLKASLRVPEHGRGRFLNFRVSWVQDRGYLKISLFRVGSLRVPGWLIQPILTTSVRLSREHAAVDLIQNIAISRGTLLVTYRWQPKLLETVRKRMVPEAEANRLEVFHAELVRFVDENARSKRVSMASLLKRLFRFASARSEGHPVADNRAIFMVAGAYVNGRGLEELIPEARTWRVPKRLTLTLRGRKDLARHFLTSAALAVTGGGFFSDTMGVYKEMADAQKGSGFSFGDLAADRAGTRFSDIATQSPESAKKLWDVFAGPVRESDFMPSVKNLPEFMSETAFRSRFGTVGSSAYNRVAREIEQRISALPLYRRGTT